MRDNFIKKTLSTFRDFNCNLTDIFHGNKVLNDGTRSLLAFLPIIPES